MKSTLLLLCLSLSICVPSVFAKDTTEAEYVEILKKVLFSENVMASTYRTFPNLGKQKGQLFREHYYWFGKNEKLLQKIAHDLNQTGHLKESNSKKISEKEIRQFRDTMMVMMMSYYQKGLLKSNSEDLRKYSKVSLRVVRLMPYGQCKKYNFGPFDSKFYAQLVHDQGRLYDSFTLSEMREYFTHVRRVIDNALDDSMFERQLDSVTQKLATKALENALVDKLDSLSTKKRERIVNALIYPESATDKDACEAGILSMEALDSLDGKPFVWASTYLLYEAMK